MVGINRIFENAGHTYGPEDEGGQGVNPQTGLTAYETKQRLFQIKKQQDIEAAAAEEQRKKLLAEQEAANERETQRRLQLDAIQRQRDMEDWQKKQNILAAAEEEQKKKLKTENDAEAAKLMGKMTGPTWHPGPPVNPFEVPDPFGAGGSMMPPVASQGVIDDLRKVRANPGTVVSAEDLQQWRVRQMEMEQQRQDKARVQQEKEYKDSLARLTKGMERTKRNAEKAARIKDVADKAAVARRAAEMKVDEANAAYPGDAPNFEYDGPHGKVKYDVRQNPSDIQSDSLRKQAQDYREAYNKWELKKKQAENELKLAQEKEKTDTRDAEIQSTISSVVTDGDPQDAYQDMYELLRVRAQYLDDLGPFKRNLDETLQRLQDQFPDVARQIQMELDQKKAEMSKQNGAGVSGTASGEGTVGTKTSPNQQRPVQAGPPNVQSGGVSDPDSIPAMRQRRQELHEQIMEYNKAKKDPPKQLIEEASALNRKMEKAGASWGDKSSLLKRRQELADYLRHNFISGSAMSDEEAARIEAEINKLDEKLGSGYDVMLSMKYKPSQRKEFFRRKKQHGSN